MNKQMIKMTAMAAAMMGMMGVVNAAHAANLADVEMRAVVSKTTCDITMDGADGALKVVDFGSFVPGDFTGKVAATPITATPFTVSFANCKGEDVAMGDNVELQAMGPTAIGSSQTAFGSTTSDAKIGFALGLAWTNDAAASTITATSGTLNPKTNAVAIFSPVAEENGAADGLALPTVTVTPQLFTWDATSVGSTKLDTTVSLSVAYN